MRKYALFAFSTLLALSLSAGHSFAQSQHDTAAAVAAAAAQIQALNDQMANQRAINASNNAAAAERQAELLRLQQQRLDEQIAQARANQQAQQDRWNALQSAASSGNGSQGGGKKCPIGTCPSAGCYSSTRSPCTCNPIPPGHSCAAQ